MLHTRIENEHLRPALQRKVVGLLDLFLNLILFLFYLEDTAAVKKIKPMEIQNYSHNTNKENVYAEYNKDNMYLGLHVSTHVFQ